MLRRKHKTSTKPQDSKTILDIFDEESAEAAEFRRLLLRIKQSKVSPEANENPKVLLITSAAREEGKTTLASNLAITSARFSPGTTLLIDADVRKPEIHRIFGLERDKGFPDLLLGRSEYKICLKDSGLENLRILTGGNYQVKPSEVFEEKKVSNLLSELKHSFDTIIIDCAPVLPVVDPLIWGGVVDATLMVLMAGKTPREVVLRAKKLLMDAQANLIGVIVNNAENVLPYYYDYRYKYYRYYDTKRRKYSPFRTPKARGKVRGHRRRGIEMEDGK